MILFVVFLCSFVLLRRFLYFSECTKSAVCSSGLSVRVVCWSWLPLVCGDVLVNIGSFATDHLFAKDSKNDDLFKLMCTGALFKCHQNAR